MVLQLRLSKPSTGGFLHTLCPIPPFFYGWDGSGEVTCEILVYFSVLFLSIRNPNQDHSQSSQDFFSVNVIFKISLKSKKNSQFKKYMYLCKTYTGIVDYADIA